MGNIRHVELIQVEGLASDVSGSNNSLNVEIVEFINPDGTPWSPTPPTPAPEPLECVTKTTTTGSAVVGNILTGTLATYTGGVEPVDELYQWQRSDDSTSWSGITEWSTSPELGYTTVAADKNKYVRFAGKATDADGNIAYGSGNNVGPCTAPALIITDPTILTNGIFSNPPEVYAFETISMYAAVFAGGYGTITEKYRLQEQRGGDGDWVNLTGWQSGIPTYDVSQSSPTDNLRFQTQGKDSLGTQKTSNSSTTTVGIATTIGTLSIAPPQTQTTVGQIVAFDALISGDADPIYTWYIRSGPGNIVSPTNVGPNIEVRVNSNATPGESVVVQVTAVDNSSSDNPQSTTSIIIVS